MLSLSVVSGNPSMRRLSAAGYLGIARAPAHPIFDGAMDRAKGNPDARSHRSQHQTNACSAAASHHCVDAGQSGPTIDTCAQQSAVPRGVSHEPVAHMIA